MVNDGSGRGTGDTRDDIAPIQPAEEGASKAGASGGTGRDGGPITDGVAVSVVARQEGTPGHGVIKLHDMSAESPTSEIIVGRPGFNNHSPSVGERTDGPASRLDVAWVESAAGDASGIGRIMLQRVGFELGKMGHPAALLAVPANDNAIWVADTSGAGALGFEPAVAGLDAGDTLVAWIGSDGRAHARLYPPGDDVSPAHGSHATGATGYDAVNAVMLDLGLVAAAPDGGRRLQVTEQRPGSFAIMWLALAEHDLVLRGSLFVKPQNAPAGDDPAGGWAGHQVADIALPRGFTGAFSLTAAGNDSADVIVTYSSLGAETGGISVLARRIEGSSVDGRIGQASAEFPVDAAAGAAALVMTDHGYVAHPAPPPADGPTRTVETQTQRDDDGGGDAHDLMIASHAGVNEILPIVKATDDGFILAWQTPGASDGTVAIKLSIYDALGVAVPLTGGGTVIEVTDNAAAGVGPAISGIGGGAVAAYVDAGSGSLNVRAYDHHGAGIGDATVDTGKGGAISEIAIGSQESGGEDGAYKDAFAVVYVQDNGDADGGKPEYGNIMLQRYGVPTQDGAPQQIVALGGDGYHDGNDGPVQVARDTDGNRDTIEAAVGRAPAVIGLHDGELAVIWVESDGTRETIKGDVLEADGDQLLLIDLTGLLPSTGITNGTRPILLQAGDGDFYVSWLQPDGAGGGHVVMAALYSADGPGTWIAADQSIRLKEFSGEPDQFSVAASSDGTSLIVTWQGDSSTKGSGHDIFSQSFDVEGNGLGDPTKVAQNHSHDEPLPVDTFSAAGLSDGRVVVVYTEAGRDGDVDLAARIVGTRSSGQADGADTIAGGTADDALSGSSGKGIQSGGESFATGVDQEIAINLLANDAGGALAVSRINGVPITTATPVDVGSGWVQLRDDGLLTVSPDAGYTGRIDFDYTLAAAADGAAYDRHATVDVKAGEMPAALTILNQLSDIAEGVSTAVDIKVADIAVSDDVLNTDGLSLTGLDAGLFKIVNGALYLKAGSDLDFETKPTLSIEIRADNGSEHNGALNFTLGVADVDEAAAAGAADSQSVNGGQSNHSQGDLLLFKAGYGNDAASQLGQTNGHGDVIDLSSSGYATFQQLANAGALAQVGDDVVITFNPADPEHSDKITLKGADLSILSAMDFRFV